MKLCKTKMWFIAEHSHTKVFEYCIDNLAKSMNLNIHTHTHTYAHVYISVDASTSKPAKKKGGKLPKAFLHCPTNTLARERAPP